MDTQANLLRCIPLPGRGTFLSLKHGQFDLMGFFPFAFQGLRVTTVEAVRVFLNLYRGYSRWHAAFGVL